MDVRSDIVIKCVDTLDGLTDFYCGVPAMDKFIHEGQAQSVAHHYCQLYTASVEEQIIALFALSFDSVNLDADDKQEISEGMSTTGTPDIQFDYEDTFYSKLRYPALDIAYLAVKKEFRNKHIGEFLINIIKQRAKTQTFAGCQFLTVEAYKANGYSAVPFYEKCGFAPNEFPNPNKDTLRMFYTLFSK